jgi:hypothetical protein
MLLKYSVGTVIDGNMTLNINVDFNSLPDYDNVKFIMKEANMNVDFILSDYIGCERR